MSHTHDHLDDIQERYQKELIAAGLLIESGVPGVYGRSGVFEHVIQTFDEYVRKEGQALGPEVMRFPPVITRANYLKTTHIESFPDLIGSIHSFYGKEKDHLEMLRKIQDGEEWTGDLGPTALMLTPAICYPLYPTAKDSVLSENGRLVDLVGFAFRHEPSNDPARMQTFRMHEFVRMGTPEQALAHRDNWLKKGEEMLRALELDAKPALANDPFFGRGGRAMVVSQREQELKYELVVAITSEEKPTAIASSNYHLDHFSHPFNIKLQSGELAHTACVGFGLERTALALFKKFGFDPKTWPAATKNLLGL
ncbi:MAG: amino acid--[acyl-carrier-protein] ligase [Anaerolineales bacterium]|nr:amino acid--[acyl-carrier-protein] ligase [Anaerolineales bacterium]MBK8823206.1 amino acid--[acyl-carrier-protein] ligase [Anaerolineales bacterium]